MIYKNGLIEFYYLICAILEIGHIEKKIRLIYATTVTVDNNNIHKLFLKNIQTILSGIKSDFICVPYRTYRVSSPPEFLITFYDMNTYVLQWVTYSL